MSMIHPGVFDADLHFKNLVDPMSREQCLARHRVVFEPPDLITTWPQKSFNNVENGIIWEYIDEVTANVERFYWIANISELERMSGVNVRQSPGATRSLGRLHGLACIYGSFTQRTLMNLVSRATSVMGLRAKDSEVAFFDNELAARQWLESLRQRAQTSG